MKITVSLVLFAAILLPAAPVAGLSAGELLAMGSKSGFDELKDSGKHEEKSVNGAGKVKEREEERSPKEGNDDPGNSPSRKKPRLKYRDLYECGC